MNRYFTKTFLKFFVGFVAIITIAFGAIVVVSNIGVPNTGYVASPSNSK